MPDSDQLSISWTDKVYNEDNNPSLIYNSSVGEIESKYAEKGFSVNENILFIQDEVQDASGHYFCEIHFTNETKLTVPYEVRIICEFIFFRIFSYIAGRREAMWTPRNFLITR